MAAWMQNYDSSGMERTYLKERWGGGSRHVFTGRHARELSYLVPVEESPPPAHQLPNLFWASEEKKYWCRLELSLMIFHILSFAFQNAVTSLGSIGYLPANVLKFR